jgi:hypothetical protein
MEARASAFRRIAWFCALDATGGGFLSTLSNKRLGKEENAIANCMPLRREVRSIGGSTNCDLPPGMEPVLKLELGLSQRQPRSFAEA